ncbi:MAG: hypothetical protein ACFFBD_06395 [Candidatus Hodarchaeota archaeon]
MQNDNLTESWYCKNCNVKNVPRSYRDMNAEFTVSEDIKRSIDNVIAIKKIQPHEQEQAIQLASILMAKNIPPTIIAVECPLCGTKDLVPKFGALQPSEKIRKGQFRTVSRISKEATAELRTQLKHSSDRRGFFQRFPIWVILLGISFLITIVVFILQNFII